MKMSVGARAKIYLIAAEELPLPSMPLVERHAG